MKTTEKVINVTFDNFVEGVNGRKVFWIDGTDIFVYPIDWSQWKKEKKEEGYTIVLDSKEV